MRSGITALLAFAIALFLLTPFSRAQVTQLSDATAPPVHGVGHNYIGMLNEQVNPVTGTLNIHIGIPQAAGRQLTVPLALEYNSGQAWFLARRSQPAGSCTAQNGPCPHPKGYAVNSAAAGNLTWGGWSATFPESSYMAWQQWPFCPNGFCGPNPCNVSAGFMFKAPDGSAHQFNLSHLNPSYPGVCAQTSPRLVEADTANDTYYQAALPYNNNSTVLGYPSVATPDGTVYVFSASGLSGIGSAIYTLPTLIEDRNGNKVQISSSSLAPPNNSSNILSIIDTVGRNEITISAFGFSTTASAVTAGGNPTLSTGKNLQ